MAIDLPSLLAFATGNLMSADIEVFHFDDERPNFESYARENGFKYWLASQLQECLGYATMAPLSKAINSAIAACAALEIPINENFQEVQSTKSPRDWKLSRFACYMTVMNGDPRDPKIAQAQAYFITMAEAFRQHVQEATNVERVLIRGELSEREKTLSGTASAQGVENYAFFQNAGYRGMYNMDLALLRAKKGVPDRRSPLDFMGKTELAANLFRLTQTEERIRNRDVRGQRPLEKTAEFVGKEVRETMQRLSGTKPEALPPSEDIRRVHQGLKKAHKGYASLDKPKN